MITYTTLRDAMEELGQPAFRARQAYQVLTRSLVTSFDQMTALPASLRAQLADRLVVTQLREQTTLESASGDAQKTAFVARDGALVEAVLLRTARRATVCVSSQVGCAVGCPFCASGAHGLQRDLTAEEIVDQVLFFARRLRAEDRHVTNVVVMGMGEPFMNYDATLTACRLLNDPDGFALGARAISVSTAGVVPGIRRFAAEPYQFNLAVSLHAPTDALRDRLVPLNRKYPLPVLLEACAAYVQRTRRRLFFEYVVLSGVNDGAAEVAALARLMRRPLYHLNLIAFNAVGSVFTRPRPGEVAELARALRVAGVSCTVRRSPGAGIQAACGQLTAGDRLRRTASP